MNTWSLLTRFLCLRQHKPAQHRKAAWWPQPVDPTSNSLGSRKEAEAASAFSLSQSQLHRDESSCSKAWNWRGFAPTLCSNALLQRFAPTLCSNALLQRFAPRSSRLCSSSARVTVRLAHLGSTHVCSMRGHLGDTLLSQAHKIARRRKVQNSTHLGVVMGEMTHPFRHTLRLLTLERD